MDCSSPCFVCREQYRLVYHPVLSVLDNNGWKINLFCLSWTILVCLSIGFVCLDNNSWAMSRFCPSLTITVGISRLYVIDDIGWYISQFLFVNKIGWSINRFCLSWTIMVGLSPKYVCHGQYWLLYLPVLSAVDNNGLYINRF